MKAWFQPILLLCDDKQQIVTDGYPDLRVHRILGRPIERLDMQVLLDPFEENLNLPPFPIEFGNCNRLQHGVIGQESVYLSVPKVFIDNEPEVVRVFSGCVVARKMDGLVRYETRLRIDLAVFKDFILHVVLGPCHEPCVLLMEMGVKGVELHIALVHEIIGSGFYRNLVHHLGIVDRGLREADKSGDGAVEIHQGVHLEATLPVMERSPRAEGKAQLNCAAVKRADHLVKVYAEPVIGIKFLGLLYQCVAKVLIDAPVALLIGLGEGRLRHNLQPGPVEVSGAKVKSCLDVSQSAPVRELGETHDKELIPTIELHSMPVAFIPGDAFAEFIFGEKRHKLREDCFTLVHGLREAAKVPLRKHTSSNQKIIFAP